MVDPNPKQNGHANKCQMGQNLQHPVYELGKL